MKVLRRYPDEPWRDVIVRYASDLTINDSGIGPETMTEEFEFLVEEQGFSERDAAWDVCSGYGLLDTIDAQFWDEEETEDAFV